jgi:hypothetical protein
LGERKISPRAPRVAFLALAAVSGACGARPLAGVAPDGGDAPDGGTDVAGGPACPAPAACNDDPAMSALAGTCVALGDYWYCQCTAGFSLNPKTQRCRAGSACVAAAADAWPFRTGFDTSDCASRPAVACDAPASGGQSLILAKLGRLSIANPTCSLPSYLTVRVELVDGCATLLEGRGPTDDQGPVQQYDLDFLECFGAELAATRFACGNATDCYMAEWDTLAP